MRMPLRPLNPPSNLSVIAFVCLVPLLFPASLKCQPYTSTWVSGPKSSLRLIAAGGGPPGTGYRAGIEIQLDPGALTYWRTPGTAGVPPEFSFEGSTNIAAIAVTYPAPTRFVEDGTDVFGYRGNVIFPIRVMPKDWSHPVQLVLNLSYAVCARICIPGKAEAKLTLIPSQAGTSPSSAQASIIAAAEALVPAHLTAQQRDDKVQILRDDAASSPTWRIFPRDGTAQDVFAEAPPGWYFDTRASNRPNEFLIIEAERPYSGTVRPSVVLTLKNEQQSYEFAADLDAVPSSVNSIEAAPQAVFPSTRTK